jgi:hypothetical protein
MKEIEKGNFCGDLVFSVSVAIPVAQQNFLYIPIFIVKNITNRN